MALQTRTVIRIDAGTLREPVETPQGFLRVDGWVSRPGIYRYVNTVQDEKDGLGKAGSIRSELRPEEEVFRADAMAGYEGLPITLDHPGKMIDLSNVRSLEVGSVTGPAWRDGLRVATSMVIKDKKAIAEVRSRKRSQLSPGYKMRLDAGGGIDPKYGPYDFVQRDITPNHLALVDRARGGSDLQVRMDRADCAVEYRADELTIGMLLTDEVDGHQHTVCVDGDDSAGRTSCAIAVDAVESHYHMWIRNADGSITVAADSGHDHKIKAVASPIDPLSAALASIGAGYDAIMAVSARDDAAPPTTKPVDAKKVSAYNGGRIDSAALMRQGERTKMDKDEQIRSLQAQLAEAESKVEEKAGALAVVSERADRADAEVATCKDTIAELTTRIAAGATAAESVAIKAEAERADKAEGAVAKFEQKFDDAVKSRCGTMLKALRVMGPTFRMDRMDIRDIQAVVVKKLRPSEDVGEKVTAAYIAGRFDSLVEAWDKTARSHIALGENIAAGDVHARNDAAEKGGTAESPDTRRASWRNQAKAPNVSARRAAQEK